jgi:hypothetical protein
MKMYNVRFLTDGETEPHVKSYNAGSAGQAFQRCLEEQPGCKLVEAYREGGYLDGYGITTYEPPSAVKVKVAEPVPREDQMKFFFAK